MTRDLAALGSAIPIPSGSPDHGGKSASGAWRDWLGVLASIGCAIHCAAMPFVIAYLPALGLSFLADEAFHKWMAVGCCAIAVTAFIPGIRKHRRWTPVIVGSVGLALISIAAFGFAGECCAACELDSMSLAAASGQACTDACCPDCEHGGRAEFPGMSSAGLSASSPESSAWVSRIIPWLTPLGGMVLVCAHLLNRRYGCLCGCCGSKAVERIA